jgi:TolB-like protein
MGGEYRMTAYATDIEKASSSQRSFNIKPDSRLNALLNASAEEEIERAVAAMAKGIDQKTVIAIGRISYGNTQTVSNFSAWLKNSVIASAQKQQDKFQIATETQSADFAVASRGLTVETPAQNSSIQAVVTGSYSPLDNGAEVSAQLVSTGGDKMILASVRFAIPAAELERRKLSLLPETNGAATTKDQFDRRQKAVDPYAGKNNKWTLTVTPDVLDNIYYDQDFMSMRIYSQRDCYFRITHVDVNGKAQVIYPLNPNDNNFIRAGETRTIPDNTRFRMGPPFGEEIILVAAYEKPFTNTTAPGAELAETISRGLTVESNDNTTMNPGATAKFSYTILPRR